jgi:hypothetical protein
MPISAEEILEVHMRVVEAKELRNVVSFGKSK